MGKCKTCRFWTEGRRRRHGPWDKGSPLGFGGCISERNQVTVHISDDDWERYESDMMITEYDEEWGFWTGADFGCIHHEEKPEAEEQ